MRGAFSKSPNTLTDGVGPSGKERCPERESGGDDAAFLPRNHLGLHKSCSPDRSRAGNRPFYSELPRMGFESCGFGGASRDLSLGDLHFGVAAWLCRVHRGSNAAEMQTHHRPLRVFKHQNGDLAASQVLLILDILVCREQYLEAGRLRGIQQITVRDLVPAALSRLNNSVPHKRWRDAARRAVVKENEHRRTWTWT